MASEAGEWLGGAIRLLFLRTAKQPRGGSNGSCTNTLIPAISIEPPCACATYSSAPKKPITGMQRASDFSKHQRLDSTSSGGSSAGVYRSNGSAINSAFSSLGASDAGQPKLFSTTTFELRLDFTEHPATPDTPSLTGFMKRYIFQTICFALHVVLVLIHATFLISGIKHWEHHITFAVNHQTLVSFWTTAITTSFGTVRSIYSFTFLF
jgi:hypothetical protein